MASPPRTNGPRRGCLESTLPAWLTVQRQQLAEAAAQQRADARSFAAVPPRRHAALLVFGDWLQAQTPPEPNGSLMQGIRTLGKPARRG